MLSDIFLLKQALTLQIIVKSNQKVVLVEDQKFCSFNFRFALLGKPNSKLAHLKIKSKLEFKYEKFWTL